MLVSWCLCVLMQPCFVFVGEGFENNPDLRMAKSLLLDFFRGRQIDAINLKVQPQPCPAPPPPRGSSASLTFLLLLLYLDLAEAYFISFITSTFVQALLLPNGIESFLIC